MTQAIPKCAPGGDSNVLPIHLLPDGINVALIPGQNASIPWMTKCCSPSPVNSIQGCYLWCEIPQKYIHVFAQDKSLISDFNQCVMDQSRNPLNETLVATLRLVNATGATRPSAAVLCIWFLMLVGFMAAGA